MATKIYKVIKVSKYENTQIHKMSSLKGTIYGKHKAKSIKQTDSINHPTLIIIIYAYDNDQCPKFTFTPSSLLEMLLSLISH